MERPQGTQQKAAVGSLTLVAIHHSGNREFDSSQVNWLFGQNPSCFGRTKNRIYHPKYPVQNLELLFMQRNWKA